MTKLSKNPSGGTIATYTSIQIRYFMKYTGAAKMKGIIYLRLIVNGHRAPDRSVSINVDSAQWNSKDQCISSTHQDSHRLNAQLHKLRSALYDSRDQLERKGQSITGRKLLDMVFNRQTASYTLENVFGLYVAEQKATTSNSPKTYQGYEKYLRNLSRYFAQTGLKSPLLDDITKARALELLVWLKEQYVQDYVIKNAQFLKSLFSYAHTNGLIDRNPIRDLRLEKSGHYDTTHLTQEQVQQLADFDFTRLTLPADSIRVLDEERDAFILSAYCGLHHGDYSKGDYSVQFIKDRHWLTGHRIKSKGGRKDKPYSMPLHPLALAVIEKYGSVEDLPKRNNAKRNSSLKQIAAQVGLNVHLTTKTARKTLAHYCLNVLGMRSETLAAVLGHSSTKPLKHYATINNESIDREMQFLPSKPATK